MYVIDFFKSMVKKTNIPVLLYILLNIAIITIIVQTFLSGGTMEIWQALLVAILMYAVSMSIALSPVGEWALRVENGCKKIKRVEQMELIQPIFDEVYDKARRKDPSIPNNVRLYINDDTAPNAFATGRKTICITKGMLSMPKEQIRATLGHEFGHLAHKDTDLILVVTVGNIIVTLLILGIKVLLTVFYSVFEIISLFIGGTKGVVATILNTIYYALMMVLVMGASGMGPKSGWWVVMMGGRAMETKADR